jgi:hypothetical protein
MDYKLIAEIKRKGGQPTGAAEITPSGLTRITVSTMFCSAPKNSDAHNGSLPALGVVRSNAVVLRTTDKAEPGIAERALQFYEAVTGLFAAAMCRRITTRSRRSLRKKSHKNGKSLAWRARASR